jgi:ABC-type multidrug transport system fused ATPase/permease subunit
MKGRTVISIAHRLSTIQQSDRIAVLKDGTIAEVGSYEELIERKDSAFRELMGRQLVLDE